MKLQSLRTFQSVLNIFSDIQKVLTNSTQIDKACESLGVFGRLLESLGCPESLVVSLEIFLSIWESENL